MADPVTVVEAYLRAVPDPATPDEQLEQLLHPDFEFVEHPNAINPAGSTRDRATSLQGIKLSREILASAAFEVVDHVVDGDHVSSRLIWRGRIARDLGPLRAGTDLTAHVSQHNWVRDGRIMRTETFDCYEPFS